jgi:hypothetical protein
MAQIEKEKLIESMFSKLKEDVTDSEGFLTGQTFDTKRVQFLIKTIEEILEDNSSLDHNVKISLNLVLRDLKYLQDQYSYYTKTLLRAAKDYRAYLNALETLYAQGNNETQELVSSQKQARNHTDSQRSEPHLEEEKAGKGSVEASLTEPNTDLKVENSKMGRFKLKLP